jgi:predicted nucleic acid-binding protein
VALGGSFLVDKSAWVQRVHSDAARTRIDELRAGKRLYLCAVTVAELLYSSRNASEMQADHGALRLLGTVHITPQAEEQVARTMKLFAAKGQHRAPSIADLFVAAVAKVNNMTVLHYDKDFELIANATGQSHEWIIPRGTGHGRD